MTPTRETFGNIPESSQALFYILAVVAMAVFIRGIWQRFQLWRQGQPIGFRELLVGNLRQILARLRPGFRRVFIEGFGQQRVRGRGLPSWAHGWLMFGFLILLLGTTLLEIDHLATMMSGTLKFHRGLYYLIYEFALDLFGLLFLAGCWLFFWRRLRKPASVGHTATDWYVLLSFIAIGVTGYLVEGLRIAWQKPEGIGADCSPVGLLISSWFNGASEPGLRSAHLAIWWTHSIFVFGFIASVPHTRLRHTIAGPLNLFFARPTLGVLQPITIEQMEKDERLGVSDIRHLTRQQLLSLDACMECGRCEEVCPAFATGKPLSPKRVVQDLKSVMEKLAEIGDWSRANSEAAGTPTRESSLNAHAIISPGTLWSCTACSACVWVCPVRIDQVTMILDLRRHLVADGGLSGTAATALRRMQSSANPWGLPAGERAHWIESLNPTPPNHPANP